MKNKLIDYLFDFSSELIFNEKEHFYFYKNKKLISVSQTQEFFKEAIKNIPKEIMKKAAKRGTDVHNILEEVAIASFANGIPVSKILKSNSNYSSKKEHQEYLDVAIKLFSRLEENGYEVLIPEYRLMNVKDGVAGTIDLILYKQISDKEIWLIVLDYKTGELRISNWAQIALYQYLLKRALQKFCDENKVTIKIIPELISLKNGERFL